MGIGPDGPPIRTGQWCPPHQCDCTTSSYHQKAWVFGFIEARVRPNRGGGVHMTRHRGDGLRGQAPTSSGRGHPGTTDQASANNSLPGTTMAAPACPKTSPHYGRPGTDDKPGCETRRTMVASYEGALKKSRHFFGPRVSRGAWGPRGQTGGGTQPGEPRVPHRHTKDPRGRCCRRPPVSPHRHAGTQGHHPRGPQGHPLGATTGNPPGRCPHRPPPLRGDSRNTKNASSFQSLLGEQSRDGDA